MYVFVYVYVSVLCTYVNMSAVPMEARIGHQMPWGWSNR